MSDAGAANQTSAIDVGSRRQLFIDDRFIAKARDVALTMNPPTQHDEPLLVGDRPWEPLGLGIERQSQQGATVVRDAAAPPEERYRLWTKFQPTDDELARGARPGLYAMHSPDGLRWTPYPNQPTPVYSSATPRICCSGITVSISGWATPGCARPSAFRLRQGELYGFDVTER
jgi:hypothetical protein